MLLELHPATLTATVDMMINARQQSVILLINLAQRAKPCLHYIAAGGVRAYFLEPDSGVKFNRLACCPYELGCESAGHCITLRSGYRGTLGRPQLQATGSSDPDSQRAMNRRKNCKQATTVNKTAVKGAG